MPSPILAPVIVLVLWTLAMCVWLYATRIPALKKHNIVYDPHRPSEEFHAQIPAEVRWKADNYNNLLEQPTIFYAVALTLAFLGAGSGVNASLAWLYVALRIAHSLVQALMNKVMIRFALFAAASIVLLVMAVRAAYAVIEGCTATQHPPVVWRLARPLGRQYARHRCDELQPEDRSSGLARELASGRALDADQSEHP